MYPQMQRVAFEACYLHNNDPQMGRDPYAGRLPMPLRPAYGSRPIRGLTSPRILCRKWVATHMRVINSYNYDPHMGRDPFAGRYCANDMPQMQRVAFEGTFMCRKCNALHLRNAYRYIYPQMGRVAFAV